MSQWGRDRKMGRSNNRQDLLNFVVGESEGYHYSQSSAHNGGGGQSAASRTAKARSGGGGGSGGKGASFMLGNFRIGIRRQADTSATLAKCVHVHDAMVPWDKVEQVVTTGVFEEHRCPICLDQPRAARITRCGHVFCLPCLLQYRQQMRELKKPIACPLCQADVAMKDTKLVSIVPAKMHAEGDVLMFTLVKRVKDMVVSFASDDRVLKKNEPPGVLTESARFSRYFMLEQSDVLEMLSRDVAELQQCMDAAEDEGDDTETVVLTEALQAVIEYCDKVASAEPATPVDAETTSGAAAREHPTSALSLQYQAADGQFYFFSNLCMKMMLHHVADMMGMGGDPAGLAEGSVPWNAFPPEVECRVQHMEWHTFGEQNAKRFKYASHLPYGTQFCVLDVDLSGVVSGETLRRFEADLGARREKLAHAARQEKEERRRQVARRRREEMEKRGGRNCSPLFDFSGTSTAGALAFDPSIDAVPDRGDLAAFPALPGGDAAQSWPTAGSDGGAGPLTSPLLSDEGPQPTPPDYSLDPVRYTTRRIDPADGKLYTRAEFDDFYGKDGAEKWGAAMEVCERRWWWGRFSSSFWFRFSVVIFVPPTQGAPKIEAPSISQLREMEMAAKKAAKAPCKTSQYGAAWGGAAKVCRGAALCCAVLCCVVLLYLFFFPPFRLAGCRTDGAIANRRSPGPEAGHAHRHKQREARRNKGRQEEVEGSEDLSEHRHDRQVDIGGGGGRGLLERRYAVAARGLMTNHAPLSPPFTA